MENLKMEAEDASIPGANDTHQSAIPSTSNPVIKMERKVELSPCLTLQSLPTAIPVETKPVPAQPTIENRSSRRRKRIDYAQMAAGKGIKSEDVTDEELAAFASLELSKFG